MRTVPAEQVVPHICHGLSTSSLKRRQQSDTIGSRPLSEPIPDTAKVDRSDSATSTTFALVSHIR
ncbi:hypothetical protein GCM10027612_87430 [Microbispora bryophytorum subsp. camponoti]